MENSKIGSETFTEDSGEIALKFLELGIRAGSRGFSPDIPLSGFAAHFYVQGFISGTLQRIRENKSSKVSDNSWWKLLPL